MSERTHVRWLRRTALTLLLPALALAAACGGTSSSSGAGGDGSGGQLTLVAYSTPQEAYEEIIPAFTRTPQGRGVRFTQSYGSSGDQSRAVESGLRADLVALSLEPDVDRLVEPGKVAPGWAEDEFDGFVTRSVVTFAVREGNPKGIRTWDDLTREGVEVITPNPFTSGGAKWNVMAGYGAQLEQGDSPEEARQYLRDLFANVSVQDKSAREALATFQAGKGDVLLAYENEAVTAQQKGIELDYVTPDETILIENPVAVTSDSRNAEKADAFVDFLRTEPAQRIFVEKGYRPVLESVEDPERFPEPETLFTIRDLGDWEQVDTEFFDPEGSVVADINEQNGVSTG